MNDSMVPLLNNQSQDQDYKSQVAFDVQESTAYLTFSHGILKLFNPETKHVYDRIKAEDIIGVELEISLDGEIPNKAVKGREKMERIQNQIYKERLNGEHDELPNDECLITSKATLNIYAYPKAISNGFISKIKSCLQANDSSDHPEDRDEDGSERWYGNRYEKHRRYLLKPTENLSAARSLVSSIRNIAKLEQRDPHFRYLVMVNPFSGTKRGLETYHHVVKKMLDERGVDHDVLVTTKAGHATERVMDNYELKEGEKDLGEYDGIVVMGGDGILSEVLQGLRTRKDYDEIMKRLTFGIIGCGTSNGLAASILHAAKEKYGIIDSTFLICKGRSTKLDLSHYQTETKSYTSFLTFSWAMIADIDIESEAIRFLGILRNDVWAAWRVIRLRSYRAKFSYLPFDKSGAQPSLPQFQDEVPPHWVSIEADFILFWASHVTHAASNTLQSPESSLDDGKFTILFVRKPCSRIDILKILLSLENGGHVHHDKAEFVECAAYRLHPLADGSFNDLDGEVVESGRIQAHVVPRKISMFS